MTRGTAPKPKLPSKSPANAPASGEVTVGPLTQLLIRSRQRIVAQSRWTRGAYARDASGNACNVQDQDAVCWCAAGALEYESGRNSPTWIEDGQGKKKTNPLYHKAHALLEEAAGGVSITAINDGSGHARVLQMYNRAIVLAKGE